MPPSSLVLLALALPAPAPRARDADRGTPGVPGPGRAAPHADRLRFDQAVKPLPNSIEVRTPEGRLVSAAGRGRAGPTLVSRLRRLPRGGYTVRWEALASDGHVGSGVFTFGVRVAAPPPTEAYGASGPTPRGAPRPLGLLRLARAAARRRSASGSSCARAPLPPRVERRFCCCRGIGVVAVLEAGIAAFLLRAEDALQLPFGRLPLRRPLADRERHALRQGVRRDDARLRARRGAPLPRLADRSHGAALAGVRRSRSASRRGSRSRATRPPTPDSSWISELADWVHLSAASLWLGGLVQLAVVVWPAAPELRRAAFLRFSRLATVLRRLLARRGRLPRASCGCRTCRPLDELRRVLLVKLALVCARARVGRRPSLRRRAAARARRPGAGGCSRSLLGEAPSGWRVLLAAAVLVDSKPPPPPGARRPPALAGTAATRHRVDAAGRDLRRRGLPRPAPRAPPARGRAQRPHARLGAARRPGSSGTSRSFAATSATHATRAQLCAGADVLVHAAAALPIQGSREAIGR